MKKNNTRDADMVREVNLLWVPVYPGLARQVARYCPAPDASILEVGCFSGGTGLELLSSFPKAGLTVACDTAELVETFDRDWGGFARGDALSRCRTVTTALSRLDFADKTFELVFCRGVFFFLDGQGSILREMYRVLAPGGVLFAGGGFGSFTPPAVISRLADESRRKNNDLGRRIYSVREFEDEIARAGLERYAEIIQEGGLWALIRRPQAV